MSGAPRGDWSCLTGPALGEGNDSYGGLRFGPTGAIAPLIILKPCHCAGGQLLPPLLDGESGMFRDEDGLWHESSFLQLPAPSARRLVVGASQCFVEEEESSAFFAFLPSWFAKKRPFSGLRSRNKRPTCKSAFEGDDPADKAAEGMLNQEEPSARKNDDEEEPESLPDLYSWMYRNKARLPPYYVQSRKTGQWLFKSLGTKALNRNSVFEQSFAGARDEDEDWQTHFLRAEGFV